MMEKFLVERLTYKRTFAKKLCFIAPSFFIVYALFMLGTLESPFTYFEHTVFNWWSFIFIPFMIAIVSSLTIMRDKKSGNERDFRFYPIKFTQLWFSKIAVVGYYTLLSSLTLVLLLIGLGLFYPEALTSISTVLYASFVIWVTSLTLIPILLISAYLFGTVVTNMINIIGMVVGVIFAADSVWIYIPWSWSLRLMAPIVGVHPNGVPLENNDPLLVPSVIPLGILVAIISFIGLSLGTALIYAKKGKSP